MVAPSFLLLPVSSWYVNNPDYNEQDKIAETERLIERQGVIENVIVTDCSPDAILDLLNDRGMSPDDYIDDVIMNLENSPFLYT